MNTIKKNLLAFTVVLTTLTLRAQDSETEMLPATVYKGKIIATKTLPTVTISAKAPETGKVYTLPVVNIIAKRNLKNVYPAVKYGNGYIASVNLPQVNVVTKRKAVSIATLYKAFRFLSNSI